MKRNALLTLAAAMGLTGAAAADVRELVVEGFLTDSAGKAVVDGQYSATIQLCTAQTAGSCPWDEPTNVTTHGGYFQVRLGANPNKPLTDALFANGTNLWFELKLDTQTYPRTPLASVPYAFRAAVAGDAGTVGGFAASSTPTAGKLVVLDSAGRVPAAAVPTPTNIQCSGCVDGSDLAAGAVAFTNLSGAGCAANQVITWTGTAFACLDTAKVYTAGTGIQITNLNAITLDQAKVAEYAKAACYDTAAELTSALPTWDTLESDDINVGDSAFGDLTGTYPSPSIAAGAVTTAKVADGAVSTAKLGTDVAATLAALRADITTLQTTVAALRAVRHETAFVNGGDCSSSVKSSDWIATGKILEAGVCELTFKANVFASQPVCTTTTYGDAGDFPRYAPAIRSAMFGNGQGIVTRQSVFDSLYYTSGYTRWGQGSNPAAPFSIICVGTRGTAP